MADAPDLSMPSPTSLVLKKANKGKKRKINYEEWKQVKNKVFRNSGKPYVGSKGEIKPGRRSPEEADRCSAKCTYDGCFKLNENHEQKMFLFNDFYEFPYNGQQHFLAECADVIEPKRRTVPENVSRRKCSVKYSLPTVGKTVKLQVCQIQIMKIFDVKKRRLQLLVEKLKFKKCVEDGRGKHQNRPRNIPDEALILAEGHIRSFPAQESHYSRHSSKAAYLSPHLNLNKMYKLFKLKYPDSKLLQHTYRNIFAEKFNLKFGLPRSDTCKLCDKNFINMVAAESENEIEQLRVQSEIHHRKAEKAYKCLSDDSKVAQQNPNVIVLCVDLQQVIFTPNLSHSDIYYQRQFSNYNFCIHNMGKNEATMCVWNESTGKRGASEIASSILRYVEANFEKLVPYESRVLVIWSDRCVGQNNNWKMVTLCHYLVSMGYFTEVNQKFLVTGHSFLPCDRDFALIEKCKKVSKLFIPDDVKNMIISVKDINPFILKEMAGKFVDITPIEKQIFKHPHLKISECRWIQFSKDSPTQIRIRKCHSLLESWKVFEIIKKKKGQPTTFDKLYRKLEITQLENLYISTIAINPAKKADLVKISELLPPEYRHFYLSLTS